MTKEIRTFRLELNGEAQIREMDLDIIKYKILKNQHILKQAFIMGENSKNSKTKQNLTDFFYQWWCINVEMCGILGS